MTAPNKFAQFERLPDHHTMKSALNAALIAIAMRDPDPVEREAKLAILKKDGWL